MGSQVIKLVVAGNYSQYRDYCRENGLVPDSKQACYVNSADRLRGRNEYELVYCGTYLERRDLLKIKLMDLRISFKPVKR